MFQGAIRHFEALKIGLVWLGANFLKKQKRLDGLHSDQNCVRVADDRHVTLNSADLYAGLGLNALEGRVNRCYEGDARECALPLAHGTQAENFPAAGLVDFLIEDSVLLGNEGVPSPCE